MCTFIHISHTSFKPSSRQSLDCCCDHHAKYISFILYQLWDKHFLTIRWKTRLACAYEHKTMGKCKYGTNIETGKIQLGCIKSSFRMCLSWCCTAYFKFCICTIFDWKQSGIFVDGLDSLKRILGLYSPSGMPAYRNISLSLEAVRLSVNMIVSLRYLKGVLVAEIL